MVDVEEYREEYYRDPENTSRVTRCVNLFAVGSTYMFVLMMFSVQYTIYADRPTRLDKGLFP